MPEVITNNLYLWTSALLNKSNGGRGSNGKQEAYGIKKLRELILELAVRGKLVPQNPNDDPASALLQKIAKEKVHLLKIGAIKKERPLPDIDDNERSFELPQGWAWVRFGSVAQHNSGKTLDRGRNTGKLREYITTSNLYWGRFDLGNVRQMPIGDDELEKCSAKKGDLLICEGGEAGRAAVWPYDYDVCFQNHIHRARFYGGIDPYFAYRFFEKINASAEIDQHRKGVGISNMSSKALASIVMPLPPLAEQHRIVAKVDELMVLCDQLEKQQTHSIEAHQALVETLLGTLTRAASRQELTEAWTRIANHFDTLFTTEHSIDQLKQTILQLAIMGKLVPQDHNDEPASVLLKKIAKERDRLAEAGTIKKPKELPEITDNEKLFRLPNGWEYARLNDLGEWGAGATPLRSRHDYYGGDIPWFKSGELVGDYISESEEKVTDLALKETSLRYNKPGDVLIAMYGATIGKTSILKVAATTNQAVCACTPFTGFGNVFLLTLLKAYKNRFADQGAGGAQPNISREKIIATVIALPPTTGQHRIVAKVDELMILCDALKARLNEAQTTQVHLADAIVEQVVA